MSSFAAWRRPARSRARATERAPHRSNLRTMFITLSLLFDDGDGNLSFPGRVELHQVNPLPRAEHGLSAGQGNGEGAAHQGRLDVGVGIAFAVPVRTVPGHE